MHLHASTRPPLFKHCLLLANKLAALELALQDFDAAVRSEATPQEKEPFLYNRGLAYYFKHFEVKDDVSDFLCVFVCTLWCVCLCVLGTMRSEAMLYSVTIAGLHITLSTLKSKTM